MDSDLRVLLVDDHPVVRAGICEVLRSSQWTVCGEAANGEEGVRLALELQPDLILMDLYMPRKDGIQAARAISTLVPGTRILMLTIEDVPEVVWVSLASGVRGFISKLDAAWHLLAAMQAVADGGGYVSPSIVRTFAQSSPAARNTSAYFEQSKSEA